MNQTIKLEVSIEWSTVYERQPIKKFQEITIITKMSILPGTKAPWFSSVGIQEGKFLDISLSDFSSAGEWLVLFFYPLDFGYITPSELMELEAKRKVLEEMKCKILAVSTDSVVIHEQFASINPGF